MVYTRDIDRTQFYTREVCESLAVKIKGWVKTPEGDYELECSIREDDHTPSCRINPRKGVFYDYGKGGKGKETYLSELFKMRGIPDPYQNEKGAAQAASSPPRDNSALRLWEASQAATSHPYATRKGISVEGLRVSSAGELLVPCYDASGEIVAVERISPDGNKKSLGPKKGAYHLIGDKLDESLPLLVVEGYATGCSLRAITAWNVACAFGEANIKNAVEALGKRFHGDIAIAPDAQSADLSGDFDVVEIPGDRPKNTDWNDLCAQHGAEIVKQMFRDQWTNRRKVEKIVEPPKHSILDVVKSPSPGTAVKPEKVWYFPRKHLNLVAADSGMGKSLLITKVCCDLSVGAPVLETTAEPIRKTLYLNGECGRDYFDWRFLSSGWNYSEKYFKVLHQEDLAEDGIDLDLDTPQGRKNLEILLDGIGPDLLVIDSLPAFSNEDLNDGATQNEIGKYLKQLAIKHNLALVLITHLRKRRLQDQSTEPTLSEIQGSNAAAKLCNVALAVFEKVVEIDGEERTVKVCKSVKSWGKQVAPFGFCFPELDEDSLAIEMVDLPRSKQLTGSWERVRDALKHTEFNRQAVESILGVSERTAKKLLSDWKQQGKIESIGRGPKAAYLVRNGQTAPTVHISAPIPTNPVIPSIESVHVKCTDTTPQEGNLSVQNTCTDSNPVISMNDDVSVQYIDGGVPIGAPIENRVVESVQSLSPCGNLERFNLPMNRTKEKARQEFFALLDEGVEVDCLTGKPYAEIETSLPCGPSQQWLESQPSEVKEFFESERLRITRIGLEDEAEEKALRNAFTKYGEVSA